MPADLPDASGIDRPRAVAPSGQFQVMFWLLLIFFLGMNAFFLLLGILDFEKRLHVKERGIATTGTITRTYIQTDKHGDKSYHVDYIYRTREKYGENSIDFYGTDVISSFDYYAHQTGDFIPIAYDGKVTGRSFTNFHNSAFENDPWQRLNTILTVMGILFPVFAILPALYLPAYVRERRLLAWGLMTTGTVIDEEEYNAGRAGRCSRIIYCFTDNHGQVIEGKRNLLPTSKNQDSRSRKLRSRIFDHTTVFFDPPEKHQKPCLSTGLGAPARTAELGCFLCRRLVRH